MSNEQPSVSVILPARNEAQGLTKVLPGLLNNPKISEIIVVNDASTDNTLQVCQEHNVQVITHRYPMGNGASVKTGARAAKGEILVFMDADGQHDPADVSRLVTKLEEGYAMVVGARDSDSQASIGRHLANTVYNRLGSWMVGHPIEDLTSGFRAVYAPKLREFLYLFPNGFSYPTTLTMAFFRAGYPIAYLPIQAAKRLGKSHIKPLQDSIRFLLIIFKIGTLYSPLKLFFPASAGFFATGIAYYIYTYLTVNRFTNMSALLFIVSIVVFLIGLVSEQVTSLLYRDSGNH
jgi:glycosyltransferase involved in cell wall biosynthesis